MGLLLASRLEGWEEVQYCKRGTNICEMLLDTGTVCNHCNITFFSSVRWWAFQANQNSIVEYYWISSIVWGKYLTRQWTQRVICSIHIQRPTNERHIMSNEYSGEWTEIRQEKREPYNNSNNSIAITKSQGGWAKNEEERKMPGTYNYCRLAHRSQVKWNSCISKWCGNRAR